MLLNTESIATIYTGQLLLFECECPTQAHLFEPVILSC